MWTRKILLVVTQLCICRERNSLLFSLFDDDIGVRPYGERLTTVQKEQTKNCQRQTNGITLSVMAVAWIIAWIFAIILLIFIIFFYSLTVLSDKFQHVICRYVCVCVCVRFFFLSYICIIIRFLLLLLCSSTNLAIL